MFSKKLKQLRINSDYEAQYIAQILGIAKSTYSAYENGKSMPTPDKLSKIADFFRVSIDFLLDRTNDPTPYRDINADLHADRDFDKELRELLKEEDMAAFYDFANMDDATKKEIIEFIRFKKGKKND